MPSRSLQPSIFLGAAVALAGCFPPDDGRDPPLDRIYFPVGVAVSPGNHKLYVANSDFDLQFNAGSLQVYDIDRLRKFLPQYCNQDSDCTDGRVCDNASTDGRAATHWCVDDVKEEPCHALGLDRKTDAERLLAPGRCGVLDPVARPRGSPALLTSVGIGAFVTDVIFRSNPSGDGGRLFLPVRGDATLHWADAAGDGEGRDELDCGQDSGGVCDDEHRSGEDPSDNTRKATLPAEPFAIAADEAGRAIVTTHQVDGAVALFVNDWDRPGEGPKLEFVLEGLSPGVIGIAHVPAPGIVALSQGRDDLEDIPHEPGFLTIFRDTPQVTLLRFFDEADASPARPFLAATSGAPITALAQGFESRGIAVDASERRTCEQGCPQDVNCVTQCADAGPECEQGCANADCVAACAGIPLDVFISNRRPASLLVGETRPDESPTTTTDLLQIYAAEVPMSFGPSRVIVGNVIDKEGALARRVFVVCFDSRKIFVYDPVLRRMETAIHTGRGPHAFAVATAVPADPAGEFALGFIGHFTDSYIGVVDLDQRHADNYGQIVLTVGAPTPPRASK